MNKLTTRDWETFFNFLINRNNMAEFGERCTAIGLTPSNLDCLGNIILTNGMVIELKTSSCVQWKRISEILDCNVSSLRSNIAKTHEKYRKLSKNVSKPGGKAQMGDFLDEPFSVPARRMDTSQDSPSAEDSSAACLNCISMCNAMEDLQERHKEKVSNLQKKMTDNEKKLEKEVRRVRLKLNKLRSVIGGAKMPKDIYRQMNRLQQSRSCWMNKFLQLRREHQRLHKMHQKTLKTSQKYRRVIRRLLKPKESKKSRPKTRATPTQEKITSEYIADLQRNLDTLERQVEHLSEPIQTKEGKEFTPAIREVSYFLQVCSLRYML